MRRLWALALALSLASPVLWSAPTIGSVMPLVNATTGRTFCTAFAIRAHLWATAGHCAAYATQYNLLVSIGGYWAVPVRAKFDEHDDWAVFESGATASPLRLASHAPSVNDAISIIGYPYGLPKPITVHGTIAARNVDLGPDEDGNTAPLSDILDITVAGGNSGSPVLKRVGFLFWHHDEVIGILWGGFNASAHSLAIPWESLHQNLSQYWDQ